MRQRGDRKTCGCSCRNGGRAAADKHLDPIHLRGIERLGSDVPDATRRRERGNPERLALSPLERRSREPAKAFLSQDLAISASVFSPHDRGVDQPAIEGVEQIARRINLDFDD